MQEDVTKNPTGPGIRATWNMAESQERFPTGMGKACLRTKLPAPRLPLLRPLLSQEPLEPPPGGRRRGGATKARVRDGDGEAGERWSGKGKGQTAWPRLRRRGATEGGA
eukprot:gene13944-biopygen12133